MIQYKQSMEFRTIKDVYDNFLLELHEAKNGNQTSLAYIENPLPTMPLVHPDELFQVLVIGGTVFHKALVKKHDEKVHIIKSHSENQQIFRTNEDFLSYIAYHMYPDNITNIAVNFAYPLSPSFRDNKLDGMLLSGSKEIQFQGLIGQLIGETIEQYLLEQQGKAVNVSLANDVICLLLSGRDQYEQESLGGAIMGTGTNISFFHNDAAINLESGNFNKFTPTDECLEIDHNSLQSGTALMEKEMAGEYLYQHFNLLARKGGLSHPPISSTKELKDLLLHGGNSEAGILARSLFEKSAAYFAAEIAAVAAFKNHDMTFIIEGSMYWENPLYQEFINHYLEKLSPFKIMITKVDESPIIGGAKLLA